VSLRGKAAVVGVAESDLGEVGPGFAPLDLIGQATLRALQDAGLDKSDVDGLFSASACYHMPTLSVGEYLGIRFRYSDATSMSGSSFVSHLFHAAAIDAGLCEVALITYGSTQRSGGGRLVTGSEADPYEAPYNPRYPVSMYAWPHPATCTSTAPRAGNWPRLRSPPGNGRSSTRRRSCARTSPWRMFSRMVSSPLSVRDCCLVTDGGGAAIVTSSERARDLEKPPSICLGLARPIGTAT
jgi:acetyl-CoA acetyltransferase